MEASRHPHTGEPDPIHPHRQLKQKRIEAFRNQESFNFDPSEKGLAAGTPSFLAANNRVIQQLEGDLKPRQYLMHKPNPDNPEQSRYAVVGTNVGAALASHLYRHLPIRLRTGFRHYVL